MKPKAQTYPNGWTAHFERSDIWYCASVRNARGDIVDRVRLDDYRMALDYWRAFKMLARAGVARTGGAV